MHANISARPFANGSIGMKHAGRGTSECAASGTTSPGMIWKGMRRHAVLFGLILLLCSLSACGITSPAAKVADGFFDAVSTEDAEQWKKLLDPDTREQFEAAMGDSELTSYLRDANKSLTDQYGTSWRGKVRILSSSPVPASDGPAGKAWLVTVSIDGDAGGKQDIPVYELDGQYWLDLSTMDMTGTAN